MRKRSLLLGPPRFATDEVRNGSPVTLERDERSLRIDQLSLKYRDLLLARNTARRDARWNVGHSGLLRMSDLPGRLNIWNRPSPLLRHPGDPLSVTRHPFMNPHQGSFNMSKGRRLSTEGGRSFLLSPLQRRYAHELHRGSVRWADTYDRYLPGNSPFRQGFKERMSVRGTIRRYGSPVLDKLKTALGVAHKTGYYHSIARGIDARNAQREARRVSDLKAAIAEFESTPNADFPPLLADLGFRVRRLGPMQQIILPSRRALKRGGHSYLLKLLRETKPRDRRPRGDLFRLMEQLADPCGRVNALTPIGAGRTDEGVRSDDVDWIERLKAMRLLPWFNVGSTITPIKPQAEDKAHWWLSGGLLAGTEPGGRGKLYYRRGSPMAELQDPEGDQPGRVHPSELLHNVRERRAHTTELVRQMSRRNWRLRRQGREAHSWVLSAPPKNRRVGLDVCAVKYHLERVTDFVRNCEFAPQVVTELCVFLAERASDLPVGLVEPAVAAVCQALVGGEDFEALQKDLAALEERCGPSPSDVAMNLLHPSAAASPPYLDNLTVFRTPRSVVPVLRVLTYARHAQLPDNSYELAVNKVMDALTEHLDLIVRRAAKPLGEYRRRVITRLCRKVARRSGLASAKELLSYLWPRYSRAHFSAQSVGDACKSVLRSGLPCDRFLETVVAALPSLLAHDSVFRLASYAPIALALSQRQLHTPITRALIHHQLVALNGKALRMKLPRKNWSPAHITMLFQAIAQDGKFDPELLNVMMPFLNQQILWRYTGRELVSVVWAFAQCGVYPERTFRLIAARVMAHAKSLSGADLARLAWAYATARVPCIEVAMLVRMRLPDVLPDMYSRDYVLLVWALSALGQWKEVKGLIRNIFLTPSMRPSTLGEWNILIDSCRVRPELQTPSDGNAPLALEVPQRTSEEVKELEEAEDRYVLCRQLMWEQSNDGYEPTADTFYSACATATRALKHDDVIGLVREAACRQIDMTSESGISIPLIAIGSFSLAKRPEPAYKMLSLLRTIGNDRSPPISTATISSPGSPHDSESTAFSPTDIAQSDVQFDAATSGMCPSRLFHLGRLLGASGFSVLLASILIADENMCDEILKLLLFESTPIVVSSSSVEDITSDLVNICDSYLRDTKQAELKTISVPVHDHGVTALPPASIDSVFSKRCAVVRATFRLMSQSGVVPDLGALHAAAVVFAAAHDCDGLISTIISARSGGGEIPSALLTAVLNGLLAAQPFSAAVTLALALFMPDDAASLAHSSPSHAPSSFPPQLVGLHPAASGRDYGNLEVNLVAWRRLLASLLHIQDARLYPLFRKEFLRRHSAQLNRHKTLGSGNVSDLVLVDGAPLSTPTVLVEERAVYLLRFLWVAVGFHSASLVLGICDTVHAVHDSEVNYSIRRRARRLRRVLSAVSLRSQPRYVHSAIVYLANLLVQSRSGSVPARVCLSPQLPTSDGLPSTVEMHLTGPFCSNCHAVLLVVSALWRSLSLTVSDGFSATHSFVDGVCSCGAAASPRVRRNARILYRRASRLSHGRDGS